VASSQDTYEWAIGENSRMNRVPSDWRQPPDYSSDRHRDNAASLKVPKRCPIKTAIGRLKTSDYENATEICGSLRNRKRELEFNLLLAVVNIAKTHKRNSDIGFVFEYAID
jgi:hypothetical protein